MIDKKQGKFILACDICGEEAPEEFYDFHDAVDYKKQKENGWKSQKIKGVWCDICPECQEGGENETRRKSKN